MSLFLACLDYPITFYISAHIFNLTIPHNDITYLREGYEKYLSTDRTKIMKKIDEIQKEDFKQLFL